MVTVMGEKIEGQVQGIDSNGALLLMDRQGEIHHFIAGDVSLHL
jgi:biotin-(acetyl-CoA carboxylase) ligase